MKKTYIKPTINMVELGREICEGFGAAQSITMGPDDALARPNRGGGYVFADFDDDLGESAFSTDNFANMDSRF